MKFNRQLYKEAYKLGYKAARLNEGRGNGYFGYSMSNNAVDAYDSGKAPLSKWSKEKIIAAIRWWYDKGEADEIVPILIKYPLGFLRYAALESTEWHHTSSHYNKTDFYEFDDLMINEFIEDPDRIQEEFEKWNAEQVAINAQKKKEKEGELVQGVLKFRVNTGTRKWSKWSWVERQGYCRKEGDWLVLYNGTGPDKQIIVRKKIGSSSQPSFEEGS